MTSWAKRAKWRKNQFEKSSKCYYCRNEMVLFCPIEMKGFQPANLATVEHLFPKSSIERKLGNFNKVLACFRCNQAKDKEWKIRNFQKRVEEFSIELDRI